MPNKKTRTLATRRDRRKSKASDWKRGVKKSLKKVGHGGNGDIQLPSIGASVSQKKGHKIRAAQPERVPRLVAPSSATLATVWPGTEDDYERTCLAEKLIDELLAKRKSAYISPCERYRYILVRRWGSGKILCWILVNPSTADHKKNDPTARKVRGFTKRAGYSGFVIVNLFAFRTKSPVVMKQAKYPIGNHNGEWLNAVLSRVPDVVVAWGNHGRHRNQDDTMLALLRLRKIKPLAIKVNANGTPAHPLMLAYSNELKHYRRSK